MTQLTISSLSKAYGAFKVFDGLDLEAKSGEIVVVFGGSGTGKTILLRLIAGVEEPTSGLISINGQDVTEVAPEHRHVGMAFQNFALFPHMSAADNIATPLQASGAEASAVKKGVEKVAKLLKIDHVLGHAPRELSNGQKQRTALARALAAEPRILLLDDPLRNVDAKLRFEMRLELPRLLRQSGATVLYVTQDYKEAMALADRIAVLAGGRFVQVAPPDKIYLEPVNLNVARLFGDPSINTVASRIELRNGQPVALIGGVAVDINARYAALAGQDVTFGVRPEAVSIVKGNKGLAAKVAAVTPLNERTVLLLSTGGGLELLASLPSESPDIPDAGAEVMLVFADAGSHIFDVKTGERLYG